MSVSSVLALLVGAASIASALPSATVRTTVERVAELPSGWTLNSRADDASPIKLSFSLRNTEQMTTLKRHIMAASDISSRNYASHLSAAEVTALRAVPEDRIAAVRSWLMDAGVDAGSVSARDDWVHVTATVKQARSLLGADIGLYAFEDEKPRLRTREYSLPQSVAQHVQFVHPVANFMAPPMARERRETARAKRVLRENSEKRAMILGTDKNVHNVEVEAFVASSYVCAREVTPSCLQELYNFSTPLATQSAKAHLGVGGFLEEYPTDEDLADFLKEQMPSLPSSLSNISFTLINGGLNPQSESEAGGEASLDVQYTIPLSYPARVSYLSTGGRGEDIDDDGSTLPTSESENEPYMEFFEALLAMSDEDLPSVLSISYADDEKSVPTAYAEKVCDLMASVTARGVSIMFASGDGGSRGVRYGNCLTNDGTNTRTTTTSFPGSCQWATSVGALDNSAVFTGADFSTGGFSRLFARPSWQDAAVESYISALNGTLSGYYNASGRAMPDVSAVGSDFLINEGGFEGTVYGTSASTPVFASVIVRINQARAMVGKKPVGFLNPALYSDSIKALLTDVTEGTSAGCAWGNTRVSGWPATTGFDCVSGLGAPGDYYKLERAFLALP
ncbi:hypothetical protein TD95_001787 [Thielaviopsis punctulata]|uniref:tripeptidyl-peptidase II n=1 Tax=Thielaviopsis punctulata TaxID=72032 RepID=A0A0F4ZMK9_9PEZI|nr:hypothetical protein TD95_001787 [Thielaviopsis punctulata]